MNADDETRLKEAIAALDRDRGRAAEIAQELLARHPDEPRAHLAFAAARSRMQDYAGAARHLDIAACIADSALLRFNLGYCHRQLGDYPRAAAHLRRGLAMPGADESLRVLAASTLGVLGRRDEAVAILGTATTPLTLFCRWQLGAADGEAVRAWFAERPDEADRAVLFWMKYDCHVYGELDDKAALARLLGPVMARHWPPALVVPDDLPAPAAHRGDWWLFKPASLSGGQGMRLLDSPSELGPTVRGILQQYVHPPLLVEGRKFNLRLLYCLSGVDPVQAWLWHDGLVFVAPQPYATPVAGATDGALDAHVVNLLRARPDAIQAAVGALPAHVVSLDHLLSCGVLDAATSAALRAGTLALARELTAALERAGFFRAVRAAGAPRAFPPRFLGLDVGFDAGLEPWLFEIERYPGIGGVSPQSAAINARFRRQWLNFTLGAPAAPEFLPIVG